MRSRRKRGVNPGVVIRTVVIAAAVVGAAYAVGGHSIANIMADRAPALALRFAPSHPVALAEQAELQFQVGNLKLAEALARQSIQATALSSEAFQVLGQIRSAAGATAEAGRAFEFTSQLSRRQTPAQIWLLRRELLAGDVETAFQRLDSAMRVSSESRETLYPILAGAIAIDALADPVTDMFATNPVWLPSFMTYAITRGIALPNLANIVLALPETSVARTAEIEAALLRAMVNRKAYSEARNFIEAVAPSDADGPVRDPAFRTRGGYPPFDWEYTNGVELRAFPAGGGGVEIEASTGKGGSVARQLVALEPGSYRLVAASRMLSSDTDGAVVWNVRCTGQAGSSSLTQLPLPSQRTGKAVSTAASFEVPATDCAAQWLELAVRATFSPGGINGIVERVEIQPIN